MIDSVGHLAVALTGLTRPPSVRCSVRWIGMYMLATEEVTPSKRGTFVVLACTVAAFGPYVTSGIRTEQVAVYGLFVVLLISPAWTRINPSRAGLRVAAAWTLLATIAAVGAALPPRNVTKYAFGSAFAGVDNFLLPLVVVASIWMVLAAGADRDRLLRIACRITVLGMCCNAALAVMSVAGFDFDLAAFYNGDGASVQSVAYRAATVGRYSGAINQPVEAGLLYSVALLAAIFLYHQRALLMAIIATLLAVGGVLTVSKVFLLIGAPIALWQLVAATGGRHRRIAAMLGMLLLVVGLAWSGMLPQWAGQDFLLRLLPSNSQDAVTLYTAGRFGTDSTLTGVTDAVLDASPVFGFGAAGLQTPYDNAWVEALAVAGVTGAVLYTAVLGVLAFAWAKARRAMPAAWSRLSGGIVAVVIGASGGVPALTANRCATIVWILLTLLVLSRQAGAAEHPSEAITPRVGTRTGTW